MGYRTSANAFDFYGNDEKAVRWERPLVLYQGQDTQQKVL